MALLLLDGGLAFASAYLAILLTLEYENAASGWSRTAALVLAGLHGGALIARRVKPRLVLACVLLTGVAYFALGYPTFWLGPPVLIALYTVAARTDRRTSLTALATTAVIVGITLLLGRFPGLDSTLFFLALVTGSWSLGDIVLRWRALAAENAHRALELERTREELARLAVTSERLRIARELHDIVAHSMTVVAMHAGSGRLALEHDPESARGALTTVERVSRNALKEIRQLLAILRNNEDDDKSRAPTPSLTDVHGLVSQVASTGTTIDVRLEGDLDAAPAGVALAAYRIVQEALTNVVKHAGPTRASVTIVATESDVSIDVTDQGGEADAAAVETAHDGQGTVGIRERVALYGGSLASGPLPRGGWRVSARLPYDVPGT